MAKVVKGGESRRGIAGGDADRKHRHGQRKSLSILRLAREKRLTGLMILNHQAFLNCFLLLVK